MAQPDLVVLTLDDSHDRGGFSCGVESLDRYFLTQAGQDLRRRANGVFVLAARAEPARVLGYYTLCATALAPGHVPEAARKHIPRTPLVSATLIGRLAVAQDRQGQRLGAILLADALRRALASAATVGSCMIVVDALHDRAAGFHAAHGFARLPESLRLVLPMRSVERMLAAPTR
ncbi:GNAT family N-acetyltransferase [Sediminicoccus sp. KRV36]|uniref:GNAT family N-acetyltransferase n=1 Tax=Sediminicoccus sp. KRV36 TaxID=3133721 RepID=UPI00200F8BC9|nr:GNAT family N-acetyltransferase [Sediminicoccus rosea]UPY36109.1 GNAT family N-acetyltransferase [Sediminicoccus rosea]